LSRVLGPAAAGFFFAGLGRHAAFFWGAGLVALAFLVVTKVIRSVAQAKRPGTEHLASPHEGGSAG